MRKRILWVTRTAIFIALLVVSQLLTAMLGNQYVTGSIVNFILIIAVSTCGLATGLTVGILSPICAFLVGAGPAMPPLIPFIILGNIALIIVWYALLRIAGPPKTGAGHKAIHYSTPVIAAVIKFLVLYCGVVLIAVPYVLGLNGQQGPGAVLSLMFSYPQIITATIGGYLAIKLIPPLKKAVGIPKNN